MAKQIEMPKTYTVPDNWIWVELGKLIDVLSGYPFQSSLFSNEKANKRPLIRIRDIVGSDTETYTSEECPDEYIVHRGEILIGMDGDFNIAKWNSDDALLNQRVCKISSKSDALLSDYMYYFLPETLKKINDATPSVTVKHLSTKTINKIQIPLPPISEQQRIVEQIESLFSKLDEAKDKANNVLEESNSRRTAILEWAFAGKLTSGWRKNQKGISNHVLKSILNYSESLSSKDKKHIKECQLKCDDVVLEDGTIWNKTVIGAVGVVTNGSTPSRKCDSYWNGSIPWVSSGEVRNNIIYQTNECITDEGYHNSSVKMLPKGTVLIAMIGEGKTRGQSAILDIEATTNQNIAAIIIEHGLINPKFMWYWLQKQYKSNREKGAGSGPQALNCQRVRDLEFMVPSVEEQDKIVEIIDMMMEKETQVSSEIESVIDSISSIKKAILAKAFRGELGTNDPTEEKSTELLKQIIE